MAAQRIGQRIGRGIGNGIGSGIGRLQRFYDTATEVAATLAPFGSFTPAHIWRCQETTGNLSDSVGSGTLTASGSPSASQYAQPTCFANRKALKILAANGAYFASAGTGVLDPGTGSVALIGIARFSDYGGATRYANLRQASQTGWIVQRYASGFYFNVDDGAGGGAGVNLFHTTAPLAADQYCAFGWGYDVATGQAWVAIASDKRSAVTRADISGLSVGSIAAQLYVGFTSNWDHDYLWLAGFTGSNANMNGKETQILDALYRG